MIAGAAIALTPTGAGQVLGAALFAKGAADFTVAATGLAVQAAWPDTDFPASTAEAIGDAVAGEFGNPQARLIANGVDIAITGAMTGGGTYAVGGLQALSRLGRVAALADTLGAVSGVLKSGLEYSEEEYLYNYGDDDDDDGWDSGNTENGRLVRGEENGQATDRDPNRAGKAGNPAPAGARPGGASRRPRTRRNPGRDPATCPYPPGEYHDIFTDVRNGELREGFTINGDPVSEETYRQWYRRHLEGKELRMGRVECP